MKRPLFWMGIAFLSSTAVFLSGLTPVRSVLAELLVLSGCVLLSRCTKRGAAVLAGCALAAGLSVAGHTALYAARMAPFYGEEVVGTLAVSQVSAYAGRTVYSGTARVRAGNVEQILPMEVTVWGGADAEAGEALSFSAQIKSKESLALSLGDPLPATEQELLASEDAPAAPRAALALAKLRASISAIACEMTQGRVQGVLCALLAGDRTLLASGVTSAFQKAGLSHLLVVSGMHLCIAAWFAKLLLASCKPKVRFCILAAFLWGCAAMTGFGVSVVRAAVMVTMAESAALFDRRGDTLTSLAFAGVLIVLVSPSAAVSASFLLSFCSVLGIALFADPMAQAITARCGRHPLLRQYLITPLCVSATAQVGTLPIAALLFGTLPVFGIVANLLAVPLMESALIAGLCGIVLPFLRQPIGWICQVLLELLLRIADGFASLPLAQIGVCERWQIVWIIGFCACCAVFAAFRPEKRIQIRAAKLGAVTLCVCAIFSVIAGRNSVTVTFFPEENVAVLVRGRSAVLLGAPQDQYDADKILTSLTRQNVTRLDFVVAADTVLPTALFSITEALPPDGIAAPDTDANRALCHAAGERLCTTNGIVAFDRVPISVSDGVICAVMDANGDKLCPSDGICAIIERYFCTLPPLSDGALRVRIPDRRLP
jgi:ComEC/Rec2-related protein